MKRSIANGTANGGGWLIGAAPVLITFTSAVTARPIRRYARILEGGGEINGSFLAADAIDELSLLFAPVADGTVGTPTLFDAGPRGATRRLQLLSAERRRGGFLWVRYRVRHAGK